MSQTDEYLSKIEPAQRAELQKIRQLVQRLAPEAEEAWSYGMPAFKYRKKYLVGFYAYKDHLSLFPTPEPIAAYKDELGEFVTAKGTVQFTVDKPLPEQLVEKLVRYRMKEIAA